MKNNTKRKLKPGQRALKEIRYYQKQEGCLMIPRATFNRFTREITSLFNEFLKFSAESLNIVHVFVEKYVVGIICNAYQITVGNKRSTLSRHDIEMAHRIKTGIGC